MQENILWVMARDYFVFDLKKLKHQQSIHHGTESIFILFSNMILLGRTESLYSPSSQEQSTDQAIRYRQTQAN